MKIRKAMTMLGVLTLAFGLSSCGDTTQSSTTTTTTEATLKHNVTVSGSGVTVVGLDSNGYAEGSVVTLGLFTDDGLIIDSVTTSNSSVTLTVNENVVTFTMPDSDVAITVTTKTESTGENLLDTMLNELSQGVSLSSIIDETQIWTYNDGSTSNTRNARYVDIAAVEDFAHAIKYSSVNAIDGNNPDEVLTPTKDTISYEYLFASNPDGDLLSVVELNPNNELDYSNVIDSETEQGFLWSKTYLNPFSLLTSEMFTVDETDSTLYHLDTSNTLYEPILRILAHYIYGEPNDYIVENLTLKTENGHIVSYEGNFESYDYTGFVYTSQISFTGNVVDAGSDVTTAPTPVEGTEISALEDIFDSLKEQNYTVVTEEISEDWWSGGLVSTFYQGISDGGNHFHQINYNGDIEDNDIVDQYLYTQFSEEDSWAPGGIAYDVQVATNIKGTWYASGSMMEDTKISENLLPSFEISSVLFEEGETANTYVLRDDLPEYFSGLTSSAYAPFTSNDVGTLTITSSNGEITFDLKAEEDSYGADELTVFSNVGTTQISDTTVVESVDSFTKWEDYFVSQSVVDEVLAIIPSNVLNYVPLPKLEEYDSLITNVGVYTEAADNFVQLQIRLDSVGGNSDAQYEDLLVLISAGLVESGFELTGLDPWLGYTFEKADTINEQAVTLNVALGSSGDIFLVEISYTAAA